MCEWEKVNFCNWFDRLVCNFSFVDVDKLLSLFKNLNYLLNVDLRTGEAFHQCDHCQLKLCGSVKRKLCFGPIHIGRGTRRLARRNQMGPVDVNGSVHTARKQHQRKYILICAHCVPRPVWIGPSNQVR